VYDVRGAQVCAYKIMDYLNGPEEDDVEISNIPEEDCLKHCRSLWFNPKDVKNKLPREIYVCVDAFILKG
jgi:hypothetical protein